MSAPQTFGEYRVVDVLGHGAMGMVYRAHDPRLDRLVALKIVHPSRVSRDETKARARLVSEARALARVSHPNVLSVYDVGVQEGVVFVALELIDGIDLAQWLRSRTRSWKDVVAVFIEAAAGLAAVHAVGLVHRDVKPANILVEHAPRGRAFGRVLLADFGIARSSEPPGSITPPDNLDVSADVEASLTEEGRVVGTPAYMAPEQHLGLDATPAADQYALCVALHEGLYGKRPFSGDVWTLLDAKTKPRTGDPPKADVPRWLWTIVCRGLAPKPEDRFPTMSDLLTALRTGAPRRRWVLPAGAAALLIGLPVASSFGRDRQCGDARAQVDEVWNESQRAAIEATFAAGTRAHAMSTLARVSERIDAHASELAAMYEETCEATRVRHEQPDALFDRRVACLEKRLDELDQTVALLAEGAGNIVDQADNLVASLDPVAACGDVVALEVGVAPPPAELRETVAEIRRTIADADALLVAGRYDDAGATIDGALELARNVDYPPVRVEALTIAGECLERRTRIEEARKALEEAIAIGLDIGYDEPVVRAATMRTFIAAEYELDVEAAERWTALGRSRLERIGDPPRPAVGLHNALGAAYAGVGRYDDAKRTYEEALARAEEDPDLARRAAIVHANLGNLWRKRGDFDRARDSYQRARDIYREEFGDDHPMAASFEVKVGQVLDLGGHYSEAVAMQRSAIATLDRTQAAPSELAFALASFGIALRNAGADAESNAAFRRALALLEDTGDTTTLAHVATMYGHSCLEQRIYDAAEAQFKRAIELLEPIDPNGTDLGMSWLGLGTIREYQSKPDEAMSLYKRALEAATVEGVTTRLGGEAMLSIAQLHHDAGRYEEASTALDRRDAILAQAPVLLPDDDLAGKIARVRLRTDFGRTREATAEIDALEALLEQARSLSGSRWLGDGELAVGRARLARGEREAGCAALARALDELAGDPRAGVEEEARAAFAKCDR